MPSLLEWLSYVFAAGNLLAGPTFELSDYLAYIGAASAGCGVLGQPILSKADDFKMNIAAAQAW